VFPYILLHSISPYDSIGEAAWAFTLYFAGIWFVAIRTLVRPERISKWRVTSIILFTAFIGSSIAVTLERHLAGTSGSLVHYTLGVGLPEEFAKALPVFLFVFLTRNKHFSPRTYLYLGAVSGIAFGAVEAVVYSVVYSSVLPSAGATYLATAIWRLITDPVSHACMAGIACYFMGLAATHRNRQVPLIGFGLGIAAVLHGAYDTTASGWFGVAVTALTIFIFVGYVLGAERIADDYRSVADQTGFGPGSSVPGQVNQNGLLVGHGSLSDVPVYRQDRMQADLLAYPNHRQSESSLYPMRAVERPDALRSGLGLFRSDL
jgi:RsiW-degrading membrane proteinase PrsW (M82 family)